MKALPIALLTGVAMLVGLFALPGHTQNIQDEKKRLRPNDVGKFMRAKLDHAQEVLHGLTVEDYDRIAKHSQKMTLLSMASNWEVLQTPQYVEFSADFDVPTDRLSKAAKEKNLDGATLAYMEMAMKCVQCHKYVRRTRIASTPNGKDVRESEQD